MPTKLLPLLSLLALGSSMGQASEPLDDSMVVECYSMPFKIQSADGTVSTRTFNVSAAPHKDLQNGWISFTETTDKATHTVQGMRAALISHTSLPSDLEQDWSYTGNGIRLALQPSSCEKGKKICTVTITLDDSITGAASGSAHETTASNSCAVYYALTVSEAIHAAILHHPGVAAAKEAVLATRALRGKLWERYFPTISSSLAQVRSHTYSNVPGVASSSASSVSTSLAAQVVMPLSMVQLFSWRADDYSASTTQQAEFAAENTIAEETVGLYTAVELAREQRKTLQEAFLVPLQKMQSDDKVKTNVQLLAGLKSLINGINAALIGQKGALRVAEDQFRLLTGIVLDTDTPDIENPSVTLASSDVLTSSIPSYTSQKEAFGLAKNSPTLQTSQIAIQAQKNTQRITEWSPFSVNVAYGPTQSWTPLGASQPILGQRTDGLTVEGSIQINPATFLNSVKALAHLTQSQNYAYQSASDALEGKIDQDFIQVQTQIETVCTEKPQMTATFTAFGALVGAIDSGQAYDPLAAASNFPLALGTLTQLYGAITSAVSSIADIHAQIGDLNKPETWTFSDDWGNVCSKTP